jgi:hypothetical protein
MSRNPRALRSSLTAGGGLVVSLALCGCGGRTPVDTANWPSDVDGGDLPDATIDVQYDVRPDSALCNPSKCTGCCDKYNTCQPGNTASSCGSGGYVCVDCGALGVSCNASVHQCAQPAVCNPSTCPAGCCDVNTCTSGTSPTACGKGGLSCQNCQAQGQSCAASTQTCIGTPSCNSGNCPGCCMNGVCLGGSADSACGAGGGACQDCVVKGYLCDTASRQCSQKPNYCSSTTCSGCCEPSTGNCRAGTDPSACGRGGTPCGVCIGGATCDASSGTCVGPMPCGSDCRGCCNNGQCLSGADPWACGAMGEPCQNCTGPGQACEITPAGGICSTTQTCDPQNCRGCCRTDGVCGSGWTNDECGSGGVVCQNCVVFGGTCQNQSCTPGPTPDCPAAYSGCPNYYRTSQPTTSLGVCQPYDLDALRDACNGTPTSPSCGQWFQNEKATNPLCYTCVFQFTGTDAYAKCLAPYIRHTCNHELTCTLDCMNQACGQCSTQQVDQCQNDIFQGGGTCSVYTQGIWCAQDAINQKAPFCGSGPDTGDWLRAVGNHYCGTGSP